MVCHIVYTHIRGSDNCVADLLSRWSVTPNPVAKCVQLLDNIPIWMPVNSDILFLNQDI
jgi:hypothetical protein